MRRAVPLLLLCLVAAAPEHHPQPPASRPVNGLAHAWLFGRWTGGLFPVLDGMLQSDCQTQTTVIFARDVVAHASLLGGMTQQVIETVRTSPQGAEFRFAPQAQDSGSGFGCDDPNVLHVSRESASQITFPRCAAFPYPLERCPT